MDLFNLLVRARPTSHLGYVCLSILAPLYRISFLFRFIRVTLHESYVLSQMAILALDRSLMRD